MQRLDALIFDLEGTLVDGVYDLRQGVNLMLAEEGLPVLSVEQVRACLGAGTMDMCGRALLVAGSEAKKDLYPYVQRFVQYYRAAHPDPAQIMPGVIATLEACRRIGVKAAICTNKSEAATRRLLDELKLLPFFDMIAGGDSFTVHKPHPGHVQGVLEAIKTQAKDAVFIGDSEGDAKASRGAGVRCLILEGVGEVQFDPALYGARALRDLTQLPSALTALGYEWFTQR